MEIGTTSRKYSDIPLLSSRQIEALKEKGRTILLFQQLVIDVSQFEHPGMSNLLKAAAEQPSIKESFDKNNHSYNAKLILTQLTIGRKQEKTTHFGQQIFEQVQNQQITKIHQQIMTKLDLNRPIMNQVRQFSQLEKEVFVMVPKFLKSSHNLMRTQNDKGYYISQFLFQNRFWVSTLVFFSTAILLLVHSLIQQQNLMDRSLWLSFILGGLTWCPIQYFFHRFLLHHNFCKKDGDFHAHQFHHAFPNHATSISLSITHVGKYIIPIYTLIRFVFGHFYAVMFVSGILLVICLYDSLHYYFHFGRQIDIWPINMLRKSHLKHHYRNPHLGYGVTSTFYDMLFGTDFSSLNQVKPINK